MYADVVIAKAGQHTYTYRLKDNMDIRVGDIVLVPFGTGRATGVVVKIHADFKGKFKLKEICARMFPEISTGGGRFELAEWMASYYHTNMAKVINLFFPSYILTRSDTECKFLANSDVRLTDRQQKIIDYLKQRKYRWIKQKSLARMFPGVHSDMRYLTEHKLIVCRNRMSARHPLPYEFSYIIPRNFDIKNLSYVQSAFVEKLDRELMQKISNVHLLFAVTGSGKTAIYYWLVKEILQKNKSAILLVPEIALSVQTILYFMGELKNRVYLYHSLLSSEERLWIFQKVASSESCLVIGPRSALFLPVKNLALIIVDEEHDSSYKEQDRMPAYNARDIAVKFGDIYGIPVVLGSATPSLESYYKAKQGLYKEHFISERVSHYSLPDIEIVDMKEEKSHTVFSLRLINEIKRSVTEGKQAILFLNRRGYSPLLQCADCGYIFECPNCSVSLVYHRKEKKLKCHICGYTRDIPDSCPVCNSTNIVYYGYGTERVKKEISKFFPLEDIAVLDRDSVRKKGEKERIYRDFYAGKIKILIGTQMLTKGLDFPGVGVVGILNADSAIGMPDFRAEERTAQLIFQVSGRLRKSGKVIVQTKLPEDTIFKHLLNYNYRGFLEEELKDRKEFHYPPYYNLIALETFSRKRDNAKKLIDKIHKLLLDAKSDLALKGPTQPPYEKVRGYYRWRIIIYYSDNDSDSVQKAVRSVLQHLKPSERKELFVDVDPSSMF